MQDLIAQGLRPLQKRDNNERTEKQREKDLHEMIMVSL